MLGVYVTMEMIMCDIFTHSVNVVHYINEHWSSLKSLLVKVFFKFSKSFCGVLLR